MPVQRGRLSISVVVPAAVAVWGALAHHPHVWLPASSAVANVIGNWLRPWWMSDQLGELQKTSAVLKLVVAAVATYGALSFWAVLVLAVSWLF